MTDRTPTSNTRNGESSFLENSLAPNEYSPLLLNDASSVRSIRPLPDMKIRAHGIQNGILKVISAKEALSKGKSGKGHYWIDVDANHQEHDEELRDWLSQLKLSQFIIERLACPPETWSSSVLVFPKSLLAVLRILPDSTQSEEMTHLALYCYGPNILLTFTSCARNETGGQYANVLHYIQHREKLPETTIAGVLLSWLLYQIERTSRVVRDLRLTVLQMDAKMDEDIQSVDFLEIIEAKDVLLRYLSIAEEQVECLEALTSAESSTQSIEFSKLQGHLGVLNATAHATERMCLRLETHLSDLRQRHEAHQQEKINRRLAVLTVLSAVFLPLTLLTGIEGMNFEFMPELSHPWAYPTALLGMVLIAAMMTFCFWRSGWFD